MNKTWILATMALTFAASCSRDKGIDNQSDNNKIDDTTIEEIVLGAGQSVSVTPKSRGIGAVGDLDATNSWNGETVYVYGINNGEYGNEEATKTVAINGATATAPTGTKDPESGEDKTSLEWVDKSVPYYYNGNDVYDFYGAHIDDATVTPTDMKIKGDITAGFSVGITIDGTQDIMVASPIKDNDIDGNLEVTTTDRIYSAWSARRDVVPNLVFEHLLSRLNFQAKLGENETVPGGEDLDIIKITKIEILNVFDKGTLYIIPAEGELQRLEMTQKVDEAPVNFEVKTLPTGPDNDGNLVALTEVPVKSTDLAPVGEDILLYPETSYKIKVYTQQDKDKSGTIDETNEKWSQEFTVALKDNIPFKAGSMYDVNITIYGLRNIEVEATLKAWEDGGDIEIDPDKTGESETTEP